MGRSGGPLSLAGSNTPPSVDLRPHLLPCCRSKEWAKRATPLLLKTSWWRTGERNVVQFRAFFFVTIVQIDDITAIVKSSLSRCRKNVEPGKTYPPKKTCSLHNWKTAELENSCSSSEGKKLLKFILMNLVEIGWIIFEKNYRYATITNGPFV